LFPTILYVGIESGGHGDTVPVASMGATGIAWASSDATVATVTGDDASATVTAVKAGSATITATGGSMATVPVTVLSYMTADRMTGGTYYSAKNCAMAGCHDASGPDITPSGIGKHTDAQILAAATMGANPEGGDVAIGAANHSFVDPGSAGIAAYLRWLPAKGIPKADQ
jgi:hypothetical protein